MNRAQFGAAEAAMKRHTEQNIHDETHIYRVLYAALQIAKTEVDADADVVILSALLHDIGRSKKDGRGHAEVGAEMAYALLRQQGWDEKTAGHVQACIRTHSYKEGLAPQTMEAKILFDADKLDLCGAVGCARALLFGARIGEPLYVLGQDGLPGRGAKKEEKSLLREYKRKLAHLPRRMLTAEGKRLAKKSQPAMDSFFKALRRETYNKYKIGTNLLYEYISEIPKGQQ